MVHTRLEEHPWPALPTKDDFGSTTLALHYQSLRIPLGEEMCSLRERNGWLRLRCRESLSSRHYQRLLARRQTDFAYTAQTCVDFSPRAFQQWPGWSAFTI
ncbi:MULTISPECIES: beta-xylosidase family glycoside hydrolase [Dickeya]|uniref:beta-xylosidase family glycoside hydrolase n=1 Tax=Dickeya TaxID=204037 RepID=UPI0031653964